MVSDLLTVVRILLTTISCELWFHRDRLGRSYVELQLGQGSTWQDHALCFVLGTLNIHRLIHDWYLGKRAAPWDSNFSWSDLEEFDSEQVHFY